MTRSLLLTLGLCFVAGPVGASPRLAELDPLALHHWFFALREGSFDARVDAAGAALIDTPYLLDPLGEGPGPVVDPDPRFELARMDCTTFVEHVVAIARQPSLEAAREELQRIRYGGPARSYRVRNHFMMAQWIPHVIGAGYARDVTQEIGGDTVEIARKRLDAEVWAQRRSQDGGPWLAPEDIPAGDFALPIVPIATALTWAHESPERFPAGAVLNVVRTDYRSAPVRVTHQGLLVRRKGRVFMRHAARAGYQRVVDEDLRTFLGRISKYRKWPISGINLLRLLPPPGHSGAPSR